MVQGPPGTGKSHTIANLICHLLANGKKILVTAYTKRALEVLKNQLPKEFQRLTVNLLSGDSASIQDLDASVNAINDELSRTTNLDSYKGEIGKRELELFSLKSEKANTKNEWLKVKELAIRRQNINRIYQGTIAEIAERIEKERATFAWFKDEVVDIGVSDLVTELRASLGEHFVHPVKVTPKNKTTKAKRKNFILSSLSIERQKYQVRKLLKDKNHFLEFLTFLVRKTSPLGASSGMGSFQKSQMRNERSIRLSRCEAKE